MALRGGGANGSQRAFTALPAQELKIGSVDIGKVTFITLAGATKDSRTSDFDGLLTTGMFKRIMIDHAKQAGSGKAAIENAFRIALRIPVQRASVILAEDNMADPSRRRSMSIKHYRMGHDQRVLCIYGSLNVVGRKGLLTNEHKPCFRLSILLQLLKRRFHRRLIDLCLLLASGFSTLSR